MKSITSSCFRKYPLPSHNEVPGPLVFFSRQTSFMLPSMTRKMESRCLWYIINQKSKEQSGDYLRFTLYHRLLRHRQSPSIRIRFARIRGVDIWYGTGHANLGKGAQWPTFHDVVNTKGLTAFALSCEKSPIMRYSNEGCSWDLTIRINL